jgi:hypothetical protein
MSGIVSSSALKRIDISNSNATRFKKGLGLAAPRDDASREPSAYLTRCIGAVVRELKIEDTAVVMSFDVVA